MAVSLRKDPGINGWMTMQTESRQGNCNWRVTVDSRNRPSQTPDGAPWGLYVYDVEDENTFSNIKMTYWLIGNQTASVSNRDGHSNCWGSGVQGTPQVKSDGHLYTPYTWTYSCPLDATDRVVGSDGVERLFLGNFHVRFNFTQPWDYCNNVTSWAQRSITIDPDGSGPLPPEVHTFERRAGTLGPIY